MDDVGIIKVPEWNKFAPSPSFMNYSTSIQEQAREVFLRDKCHAEFVFLMHEDGDGRLIQVKTSDHNDRDRFAEWLRQVIKANDVFGVIHICEAWIYMKRGEKDHLLKQILLNEIAPSELRPEDKREALNVMAQARDGYAKTWISEIQREGKKVSLKEATEFDSFSGRFGNLFE
jgi:hypothetical protein